MAKVLAADRRGALRPLALQAPEAERLLVGMSAEERMASWHLITSQGQLYSAGAAAGPLLRLLPGGRPLAALLERFPRATERAYRLVADNRGVLGRLVPEAAKARARWRLQR